MWRKWALEVGQSKIELRLSGSIVRSTNAVDRTACDQAEDLFSASGQAPSPMFITKHQFTSAASMQRQEMNWPDFWNAE